MKNMIGFLSMLLLLGGCSKHASYEKSLEDILKLPDNYYVSGENRVSISDISGHQMFTVHINSDGKSMDLIIQDFTPAIPYRPTDTLKIKQTAEKYEQLHRNYKFESLIVRRADLIAFSRDISIPAEYIKAMNDSVANVFMKNGFKKLDNEWLEYIKPNSH